MARRAAAAALGRAAASALLHGWVCKLPRVNDIAIGIALMLFGTGLAFFFGKPFIQPQAPHLPGIDARLVERSPQVQAALDQRAVHHRHRARLRCCTGRFKNTRWGLIVRLVGDERRRPRMGYPSTRVRIAATAAGGALAGIGGAYLSLYYPGSWTEGLSSGQGLMAVALVIFARWNPLRCLAPRCCSAAPARSARRCIGRRQPGLLPVQRRTLCADASIMIATSSAHAPLRRRAGRAVRSR